MDRRTVSYSYNGYWKQYGRGWMHLPWKIDGGIDPSSPVPLELVLEEDPPVRGGIGCVSPVVTRDMG